MLATTLATAFDPGTNMEGDAAGANWVFLLPNLGFEQIVCIGSPSPKTLATLSRMGREVVVICANSRQLQEISNVSRRHGLPNIRPVTAGSFSSADLLLIADRRGARRLSRDRVLLAKLRDLLKAGGLLYFELNGPVDRLLGGKAVNSLVDVFGERQLFWLTPLSGEMLTAVPLHDRETISYFLRYGLHSPSVTLGVFKRVMRFVSRHGLSSRFSRRYAPAAARTPVNAADRPARDLRSIAQRAGAGMLHALERTEWFLRRHIPFSWRYGVLAGRAAPDPGGQPPQYLRSIAQEAGIDIDKHRWGLSAPGDYASRKVLFFLFDRASGSPEYVVKLTRHTAFNARLENEYRALSLLREKGVGDPETLPQAAFFGYHGDLAIVGETLIDGVPFCRRTKATPDCPYALDAINWLADLGAATANPLAATSEQVAQGLGKLFARFTDLYRLTPEHHVFLANQIAAIERNRHAFPLVFQHGDPGEWNIMVTRTGRVAFLDWEAAEPQGMPLWDLFYFFRSYSVWVARARGIRDSLEGFMRQFLARSPFSPIIVESTGHYCRRIGLPRQLVEPLFYTCWMHRALKHATRLAPAELESGHYVNLLRLCIEQRNAPTLSRLFSLPGVS